VTRGFYIAMVYPALIEATLTSRIFPIAMPSWVLRTLIALGRGKQRYELPKNGIIGDWESAESRFPRRGLIRIEPAIGGVA
jgi:hypothetical protein